MKTLFSLRYKSDRFASASIRGFCTVLFVTCSSINAQAFVGTVDNDDLFPYVVRIQSSVGGCTGVVSYNGLVATAAHCVWDQHGWARNLRITFKDARGETVMAGAVQIFMPEEFKSLFAAADRANWRADLARAATFQDIAFIVPDRMVEPTGFPHWITEILNADSTEDVLKADILGALNGTDNWTPDLLEKLRGKIAAQLGPLPNLRAMVVGFGNYFCNDYNSRESGCIYDGRRRYGEVPLISASSAAGVTKSEPWIWCTGQNSAGLNPVQHGDSGGPLFVRALDGRWLFAGFQSTGDNSDSCSSSLFGHFALLTTATAALAKYALAHDFEHSDIWRDTQIKRFVREYFESWSSPNSEALRRLKHLYLDSVTYYGRERSFASIYSEKEEIAFKWPKRQYRVEPASVTVTCNEFVPDKFCDVSAYVNWSVKNPSKGKSHRGTSEYRFSLYVWGLIHGYGDDRRDFDYGVGETPYIMGESGHVLRR